MTADASSPNVVAVQRPGENFVALLLKMNAVQRQISLSRLHRLQRIAEDVSEGHTLGRCDVFHHIRVRPDSVVVQAGRGDALDVLIGRG